MFHRAFLVCQTQHLVPIFIAVLLYQVMRSIATHHNFSTPVWGATRKAKCLFFPPLGVTFTLAANETKHAWVIKSDVFTQGFFRKLISQGMWSTCAKLIEGSWHSWKEVVACENEGIYIYRFYVQMAIEWGNVFVRILVNIRFDLPGHKVCKQWCCAHESGKLKWVCCHAKSWGAGEFRPTEW